MIIFPIMFGIVGALYLAACAIVNGYFIASLVWSVRDWRAARQLAEDEQAQDEAEVNARIAGVLALLCTLCRKGGYGRCTCPANCGWQGCTYDHTTFYQMTPLDRAYLEEHGIGPGEHQ